MGTTSEKLTYLNETKGLIKDSINLTGAGITSEDTFRSYASKLKKGYIDIINNGVDTLYSNFPKVTGTGSQISLNNTYNAPMELEYYGNSEQDGTPTTSSPVEIQSVTGLQNVEACGKNLFDKDNANVLNAYISLGNSKITSSNSDKCLYIPIKNNTTYTITKILSNRFVIGCVDEMPILNSSVCNPISGNQASNTTYTITSGVSSKYLVIFYYTTSDTLTEQQILDSIQIEVGSTATEYEEYQGNTYEINLGNIELNKTNTYQDRIYKDNGKWYLEKQTGRYNIDTSRITLRSDYTNIEYALIPKASDYIGYGKYGHYFVYCDRAVSSEPVGGWNNVNNINRLYSGAMTNVWWLGFTKGTGLDNIKTALTGGYIIYPLETSTTTEITNTELISQLEEIKYSYESQTNINVSSENLPFILNVSALSSE